MPHHPSSAFAAAPSSPPAPSGAPLAATAPPLGSPAPLADVGDDSFVTAVLESPVPVLVDFGAAWCPPCRVLRPVLERIAGERDDLRIVHLDTDAHPRTAAQHQILSAPTLILFRDGAPIMRLVGNRPYGRLVSELDGVLAA